VHIELTGGLGNQVFQLAAIHQWSKQNMTNPSCSFVSSGRTIRLFDSAELAEMLGFRIKSRRPLICRTKYHEKSFHYEKEFFNRKNISLATGFFQSWMYHDQVLADLKQSIDVLGRQCGCGLKEYDIENSIHIRRGDYRTDSKARDHHGLLSFEYFADAIHSSYLTGEIFHIFSDETEVAISEMNQILPDVQFTQGNCPFENVVCDLFRMSKTKKTLIISNSSFSWWSGRLSDAAVLTPNPWFNQARTSTPDLIPPSWRILESKFE
jgi:hypothetical protein